jgi:hypothetical protein
LRERNGEVLNLVAGQRQDIPEIVAELAGCGARVYKVETVKAGLEQVFIDLMQE